MVVVSNRVSNNHIVFDSTWSDPPFSSILIHSGSLWQAFYWTFGGLWMVRQARRCWLDEWWHHEKKRWIRSVCSLKCLKDLLDVRCHVSTPVGGSYGSWNQITRRNRNLKLVNCFFSDRSWTDLKWANPWFPWWFFPTSFAVRRCPWRAPVPSFQSSCQQQNQQQHRHQHQQHHQWPQWHQWHQLRRLVNMVYAVKMVATFYLLLYLERIKH